MYCLKCHTAWNWNNGAIEKGIIHNPHYYEYMRNNNQNNQRNPNDVPCGGLIELRSLSKLIDKKQSYRLETLHRITGHMLHIMQRMREQLLTPSTGPTERYILGKTDERSWHQSLYKQFKSQQTTANYIDIVETFTTVSIERFRAIYEEVITPSEAISDMLRVINYCNENIRELQKAFKLSDGTISTIKVY